MKSSVILLAIISIISLSCDGRQTKKEALERAVSEFNLKYCYTDTYSHQPRAYVEVVTDTLISNEVSVHIRNYSLLDEQILISKTTNSTAKDVKYQRVFESEVIISRASKDIFNIHISAKKFKTFDSDPFWNNATLEHVWVNQELSTAFDIKLDMSFMDPRNNAYKLYRMSIDAYGQHTLDLIKEQS